jgi:hypothetical protein
VASPPSYTPEHGQARPVTMPCVEVAEVSTVCEYVATFRMILDAVDVVVGDVVVESE